MDLGSSALVFVTPEEPVLVTKTPCKMLRLTNRPVAGIPPHPTLHRLRSYVGRGKLKRESCGTGLDLKDVTHLNPNCLVEKVPC